MASITSVMMERVWKGDPRIVSIVYANENGAPKEFRMGISVKTGNNLVSNSPDIPVADSIKDDEDSVYYNHEPEVLGRFLPPL